MLPPGCVVVDDVTVVVVVEFDVRTVVVEPGATDVVVEVVAECDGSYLS
jgi:hypothetical protein